MLSTYGFEAEHTGGDTKYFCSLDPEGLAVHFLHSLGDGAFEFGIHTTFPRLGIRCQDQYLIQPHPHHLAIIGVMEPAFALDLERFRCRGMEPDMMSHLIQNNSIRFAVFAASIERSHPDFADAVRAMSERIYGIECVAPDHLIASFASASREAARLSNEHQASETRH